MNRAKNNSRKKKKMDDKSDKNSIITAEASAKTPKIRVVACVRERATRLCTAPSPADRTFSSRFNLALFILRRLVVCRC